MHSSDVFDPQRCERSPKGGSRQAFPQMAAVALGMACAYSFLRSRLRLADISRSRRGPTSSIPASLVLADSHTTSRRMSGTILAIRRADAMSQSKADKELLKNRPLTTDNSLAI